MYEQPPDDRGTSEGGDRVPAAPPIALAVGSGRRIGRPDPQEAQLAAYSLDDARLVLRRWGWKCAAAGLSSAALAAAIVWWTFVPVYEATAWLEIKSRPVVIAFEQADNSHVFAETQLQLIKSPVVLSRVAAQPDVAMTVESEHSSSTLEWLQKGLKAGYVGRSELCEITFRATRPDVAERLANAIMDGYLALHAANANEDAKRVVELLKEEKRRRAEEVRIFQDRVRLLTKSATEDDPALLHGDERVIVQQNPVAGLEQRRLAAEVERAVLEAKLQAAEEAAGDAAGSEVSADEVDAALDANPELQALQRQFATLTAQLREHRRRSRDPDDSGARRLSSEAQDAAASLEATVAKLRPRLESELRRRLSSQRRRRMAELKDEIEDQRILERTWQERIDEQRKRIERVGDKSVDLDFARAELERAQDVFQRISDRIVVLQTEMSAPSRAAPLKRAETPSRPIEIVPYKRLAAACLAALCLPFCLAIGWERCTGRIHDGRQLTEEVEFPVLGEISMLPTRWAHAGREDALYLRDRIAFEESIDALRLVLTLSPEIHKADTLAITSAVSREGKSSLASALAASLAKSTRQPILLIDGDMRCPSLHEVFDAPLAPGLAEVLAQECSLPDAIVTTTGGTMHFLPAGRLKDSPHAILDCGEFATLLAGLKSTYRYVVIDTPPVLAASEAMIFASAAEATLVCTRRDFSCGPRFRLACKRLSAGGARLAGAVISGLPTRAWSYKYGGNIYGSDRYFDRRRPDVVEEPPPRT